MSVSVLDTYAASAHEVDEERLPCRRENPELFFAETPQDVEVAKALCLDCPVRAEGLAGAPHGRGPGRAPRRGGGRGACGGGGCPCGESSPPASAPADARKRTRCRPGQPR